MKKSLSVISMLLVLAVSLAGCATTADLEKVQAQEKANEAKADQAIKDAQTAKAAADSAAVKADQAAARAEAAIKQAEERERIAEEKAKRADEAFQKSMKK